MSPLPSPHISIVVPVYNSALILPTLVERISTVFKAEDLTFEILLIDDQSTDHSLEVISHLSLKYPYIHGYQTPKNSGQFVTTISGTEYTRGEWIVHIDDDMQYDPKDILLLHQKALKENLSVVFGISEFKYQEQNIQPSIAAFRNQLLNFIWQKYPTDSFRIFKREVVFKGERFQPTVHFEAYISINIPQKDVGYVQVTFQKRMYGTTNHSFFKKACLFFTLSEDYWGWRAQHLLFVALLTGALLAGGLSIWVCMIAGVFLFVILLLFDAPRPKVIKLNSSI